MPFMSPGGLSIFMALVHFMFCLFFLFFSCDTFIFLLLFLLLSSSSSSSSYKLHSSNP